VCSRVNLRRDDVEQQFAHRLSLIRQEFELAEEMASDLRAFWEQEQELLEKRQEGLVEERERIAIQQSNLVRKVADGIVPDQLAKQMFAEYELRLLQIEARLAKASQSDREPHINVLIDFGKRFLEQVDTMWQSADLNVKKLIQNFFFPAGALVESKGEARTGLDTTLTEVDWLHFLPIAHFGAPRVQECEHHELKRRVEFFRDLYNTFGKGQHQ